MDSGLLQREPELLQCARSLRCESFLRPPLVSLYLVNALNSLLMRLRKIWSITAKYAANANTAIITTTVVARTCFQDGHVTRRISVCSSSK